MRKLVLALTAAFIASTIRAESSATLPPAPTPAAELRVSDAIILGIVEGVTEFLPISSTGHLIIATRLLKLESDQPLTDANGQTLWYKPPAALRKEGKLSSIKSNLLRMLGREPKVDVPEGIPLTLKLAADTYTVVIQFGAIAAVALLYWSQFMAMLRGLLGRDPAGLRLLINILIAFFPAAVIGLLAHHWLEEHLFAPVPVAIAQITGALLMFYAESWRRRRDLTQAGRMEIDSPNAKSAAGIGLLQVFALWPGMSRSMTTIVGGYFAGLNPRRAAEFSFLLGFVTLTAATLYKSYSSGAAMIQVFGWSHVLLGAVVAAVTAAICVRFLVRWLTRHGLTIFAWYRILTAGVILAVFYLGK